MTPEVAPELLPAVEIAVKRLLEGGIVVYPTETFYGLGAALSKPAAIARIVELKGRGEGKPMPIIVADEEQARALWGAVPELAKKLIHSFWPGPLTLVLPARPGLPFEVAPQGEVGVRVSSHPVARELARRVGPIVATSANLSSRPECRRVSEMDRGLARKVDYVIDGGETAGGRPSTVLGFAKGKPVILREGAVQRALIEATVGT